ncbi:MAG: RNA methyltransferase tRNA(m5U54)methyltransferase, partial [Pleopsidium flavum]
QFNRDLSVLAIRAFGEDVISTRRQKREQNRLAHATKEGAGRKRKRGDVDGAAVTKNNDGTAVSGVAVEVQTNEAVLPTPEPGDLDESVSTKSNIKRAKKDVHEEIIGMEGSAQTAGQEVDEVLKVSATTTIDIPKAPTEEMLNDSSDALKITSNSDYGLPAAANHNAMSERTTSKPWKPNFTILDALSATGLRALRYAKEIPFVTSVTANDLSKEATASIQLNIQNNKLQDRIFPVTSDARVHMYSMVSQQCPKQPGGHVGKYDVIDLDPYGTAAPFFDAAVQSVTDGGLLCVTCTDSGVFASTGYLEKTYSLYGGLPIKGPHSHEGGLRLIIHAIAASAARYGLAIEPLLSLSIDFYARIFVRVTRSPAEVKFLAGKTMIVYNCDSGCGAWSTQLLARNRETKGKKGGTYHKHTLALGPSTTEHCEHCGFKTHMAGPMWAGPLHNILFTQRILDLLPGLDKETYATVPRIEGMLSTAVEETISAPLTHTTDAQATSRGSPTSFARNNPVQIDHHPFFIIPSTLSKVLHCQTPSEDELGGALRYLDYRVTRSHTKPGSIRTNAPWSVLWEVMREWVRQKSPVKEGAIKEGTAGWGIMQKSREHYRANLLKDE